MTPYFGNWNRRSNKNLARRKANASRRAVFSFLFGLLVKGGWHGGAVTGGSSSQESPCPFGAPPFALQKDTFKNRRTAALLRLIKQGGRTPAPCFFIPPSGPPLTAQKILWPAGHQSDGNSQNCHGACHLIPRLAPSYRQSPSRQPWRATQPPTHSTRHFVNNNKKTACV